MRHTIRFMVLVVLINIMLWVTPWVAGWQAVASANEFIAPTPKDKCPVCGMFVAKYPKWVAEIVFKDGSYVVFDGCKDMFKYYFNMAKYTKQKRRDDIAAIYVTEYYTLKIHNASQVVFIIGSDVLGPMGHELIPVKGDDAAKIFMIGHQGHKMLRFDQIRATDIPK